MLLRSQGPLACAIATPLICPTRLLPSCPPLLLEDMVSPQSCLQIPDRGCQHQTYRYFLSAPCRMASTFQSLPPILQDKAHIAQCRHKQGSWQRRRGNTVFFTASSGFTETRKMPAICVQQVGIYLTRNYLDCYSCRPPV